MTAHYIIKQTHRMLNFNKCIQLNLKSQIKTPHRSDFVFIFLKK